MRHRKLFTLAAGVSAVLCVGLGLLWVRSYRVVDLVGHKADSGAVVGLQAYRGSVGAVWFREPAARPGDRHFGHAGLPVRGWDQLMKEAGGDRVAGFRYVRLPGRFGCTLVPMWLVMAVLALPPGAAARRWMRERKRRSAGRCPRCGYDLRATPDRCPECGAEPAAKGEQP
jgi:hypothetical protein